MQMRRAGHPSRWSSQPPGITTTKDRGARLMIVSRHTTSVDELQGFTVPQGAGLDSSFSDTSTLVRFDHLSTEQFEIRRILSVVIISALGQTQDQEFC